MRQDQKANLLNIKLPNQETFEYLTFSFKTNDKKYIIVHIGGYIDYVDNIKKYLKKSFQCH